MTNKAIKDIMDRFNAESLMMQTGTTEFDLTACKGVDGGGLIVMKSAPYPKDILCNFHLECPFVKSFPEGTINQYTAVTFLQTEFLRALSENHDIRYDNGWTIKKTAADEKQITELIRKALEPFGLEKNIMVQYRALISYCWTNRKEEIKATCIDNIEYEEPSFLFFPYIPEGKITIMQADPGTGKTSLACAIAAAVTKGRPLLDVECGSAGNIMYLTYEEDASTLKRKLQDCDANLSRCFIIDAESFHDTTISSEYVSEIMKKMQLKLMVFDPLQSFIKGDMNRANETRQQLSILATAAAQQKCSIILISHMAKAQTKGIYRALGSIDIVGAARSVLQIVNNPEANENDTENIAIHIKSNGVKKGKSIKYRIINAANTKIGHAEFIELLDYTEKDYNAAVGREYSKYNDVDYSIIVSVALKLLEYNPEGLPFISYDDFSDCCRRFNGNAPFTNSAYKKIFEKYGKRIQAEHNIILQPLDTARKAKPFKINGDPIVTDNMRKPSCKGFRIMKTGIQTTGQLHIDE